MLDVLFLSHKALSVLHEALLLDPLPLLKLVQVALILLHFDILDVLDDLLIGSRACWFILLESAILEEAC